MVVWALQRIGWFTIRLVVTLACMWTIQQAIHLEGYLIDFRILCVCAVCLIVGVRIWMPSCSSKETTKDNNWGS